MVVEDEEPLLQVLTDMVNTIDGFKVIATAPNGEVALRLCDEAMPDIIITDVRMPIMDGIELIEQAKNKYLSIKYIITSGYSEFDYAQKAITLKVSSYLLKPVDPKELEECLVEMYAQLMNENKEYFGIFNEALRGSSLKHMVAVVKEYINTNYHKAINLNLIAHSMGYSPGYLTKSFTAEHGITPSKYLNQLRLNKAKSLLKNNMEYSVKTISEMVGYEDQGYFSRIFKKYMGISPIDYREKGE